MFWFSSGCVKPRLVKKKSLLLDIFKIKVGRGIVMNLRDIAQCFVVVKTFQVLKRHWSFFIYFVIWAFFTKLSFSGNDFYFEIITLRSLARMRFALSA